MGMVGRESRKENNGRLSITKRERERERKRERERERERDEIQKKIRTGGSRTINKSTIKRKRNTKKFRFS